MLRAGGGDGDVHGEVGGGGAWGSYGIQGFSGHSPHPMDFRCNLQRLYSICSQSQASVLSGCGNPPASSDLFQ